MEESKQKPLISQAINSEEYLTLLQFFANDLPTLILKYAKVGDIPDPEKTKKKDIDLHKAY